MSKRNWLLSFIVGTFAGLVVFVGAIWLVNSRSDRIVKQWHQPKEVNYQSFDPGADDVDVHIRQSTVEWTAECVAFAEATGHRLFIPKKMFFGGR